MSLKVAALACALPLAGFAASLELVHNGKSAYSVVIAPDASPSERHGAAELQRFVEEMSGARLPVTAEPQARMVLVGDGPALQKLHVAIPFRDLGQEGFALKTSGPHLIIAGGRLRGSMYGVYTFLEKLGCRWFAPGVNRIPKMRTIRVPPLDEVQKPAFEYREPFFSEALDRDWAARNKTNGSYQRLDAEVGGKVAYFPFVHSFDALVPPSLYFHDHPEYFSLIDGRRRAQGGQLCLTNPDVLRIGIQSVERWIAEHPEATIISVSQNDRYGYCECDNCRRVEREEGGAHSGPLLRFVNALAEEIEKKHPGKLIDTLAYQYTEDPPAKVRPRPNVRVRLCPIAACDAHAYSSCPFDAYFLKNLRAWSNITSQLYIWHYNTNFAHYLLPFPDFDELVSDIRMYKEGGVVGLFMEGAVSGGGGAENAELRSYVMAKLLWDVQADARKLIDEFHQGFYGNAAKPMRAYFDLMHRQVRLPPDGTGHHLWIYDAPSAPYLNDEFLSAARELFHQAETAAGTDAIRERVRKARLGIDYVALTRSKKFAIDGEWYRPADLNALQERWKSFLATLRHFAITNISESSLAARDDEDFTRYVRPYRIVTLENDRLRVHVVPELSGRVTHLIDKRSGKNILYEPDPASKQYPDLGGLAVNLYSDYITRTPGAIQWEAVSGSSATQASFRGTAENGLRLRRTLALSGAVLRTETTVDNPTSRPIAVSLRSGWEVDPGDLTGATLHYRNRAGATIEKPLIQSNTTPAGSESYSEAEQPAGEWKIVNRQGGWMAVNRFPNSRVGRSVLTWSAKNTNRVGMAISSIPAQMAPGEEITLAVEYGVE